MVKVLFEVLPEHVGKYIALLDSTEPPDSPSGPIENWQRLWHQLPQDHSTVSKYIEWLNKIGNASKPSKDHEFKFPDGTVISSDLETIPPALNYENEMIATVPFPYRDRTGHCQWHLESKELLDGKYLRMDTTYRWIFSARLRSLNAVINRQRTVSFLEVWGPSSGHKNERNQKIEYHESPFWLGYERGSVKVHVVGAATNPQSSSDFTHSSEILYPADDGWHEWQIVYRPSNTNGKALVAMDGKTVYAREGVPTALYAHGQQTNYAGENRIGCYTQPNWESVTMSFKDIRFDVLRV